MAAHTGPPPSPALLEKAAHIELLITDVDGVWTDGQLYYVPGDGGESVEVKGVAAHDGQAFRWWHAAGHESAIISGRDSPGIAHRAEMLGVRWIVQGQLEKVPSWERIVGEAQVDEAAICYVGDDLPDVPLLRRAGLAVAVANARDEVKAAAHLVTEARGGAGALREVIELILKARREWAAVLHRYGIGGEAPGQ